MTVRRSREHIPEILVALSFYPCGVFLTFLLQSFNTITWDESRGSRDYSFVWAPLCVAAGGLITAFILIVTKAIAKRIVWLHYYLVAIGALLLLGCGIILVNSWSWIGNSRVIDYSASTVLGGFGHGILYVAGLSYIHVRSGSYKHRMARIGLAHLGLAIGMVTSTSRMAMIFFRPTMYPVIGYFFVYSCSSVVLVFIINELCHGLSVYNYKQCLDPQLYEADFKRDRLNSALLANTSRDTKKRIVLSLTAIVAKILNGMLYNNIFWFLTMISQYNPFDNASNMINSIVSWCILGGITLGIIVSLRLKIKVLYPSMIIAKVIFLTIAATCYTNQMYGGAAVFFWLFFVAGGAAVAIPDTAIVEVSPLGITELNLFFGLFLEQIPILVSINLVREEMSSVIYDSEPLWVNVAICGGIGLFVAVLWLVAYPNTFHLRFIEIQRLILFNDTTKWSRSPQIQQPIPVQVPASVHPPTVGFIAAPGHTIVPPPPHPVAPQPSQGYYSAAPMYPGQPLMYMMPQPQYPPHPYPQHQAPIAVASGSGNAPPVNEKSQLIDEIMGQPGQATAPQLSPVPNTNQSGSQIYPDHPPPDYEAAIRI